MTEKSYRMPVVHIIDDDDDVRASLVFLLESVGLTALHYPDAGSFLSEADFDEPAVVVVDVRMPAMNGLDLQVELTRRGYPAPVIFCSAHGDVAMTVRAMRSGAVDFLMKPYDPQVLIDSVQRQLTAATSLFETAAARRDAVSRIARLTRREREVLAGVIEGLASQAIATQLGVSVKTVDVHRAHIRSKTDADSLGSLVRDVLRNDIDLLGED